MFRNYVSAAFGNIGRNGVYAGITILGLAISFAAAILIGLFLRDEYSFDRFVADHQRVYLVSSTVTFPGAKPAQFDATAPMVGGLMKLDLPEIEYAARLEGSHAVIRKGDVTTQQDLAWADPDFFKAMAMPVLAGDPNAAMAAPDGLVLTREAARRFFGQDAPIGQVLRVNAALEIPGIAAEETRLLTTFRPMRVMAVLKDIPSSSHLRVQMFGSGRSPGSLLALEDRHASPYNLDVATYVKLKPGAAVDAVDARLPGFADRRFPGPDHARSATRFALKALPGLHFSAARGQGDGEPALRPPGDARVDAGVAGEGLLIVLIAAINFVTLMTARATRRAVEVGVRKASGATRRDLIVQFMGEALVYVLIAMVAAVVLAELALPWLNGFLGKTMVFDYLSDPWLAAAIVGATLLTAALAGVYPALVLSSFRPAATLKGGTTVSTGSGAARQALVVAQFAIVISLILVTATVYRQTQFALHDALRLDTSQNLRIATNCRQAFRDELESLPGVKQVSCGSLAAMSAGLTLTSVSMPDRTTRTINYAPVDVGFFEMHGIRALKGRLFSASHGEDVALRNLDPGPDVQPTVVLNESGARLLGYANPADAVGKILTWGRFSAKIGNTTAPQPHPSRIIGVIPDFTLGSVRTAIQPALYFVDPSAGRFVVAKLDGARMPETLRAMDALWRRLGHDRPLAFDFEEATVQALYRDVILQGVAIAVCAGLAVFIACLGLFALAAFVTERRTKEIGVRKAMGADTTDVIRLLIWQFTQPVLWANLVAWPAAFFVMDWWLHGFAYRVSLPPWLFLVASLAAMAIAWITVSFQSWMAARAKPASALRYE
jgi:putative ABC transport system permease protein